MLSNDPRFEIGYVLDDLRKKVGDADFGYRAQGLFAHTLMRVGWTIKDIKAQGHPDIVAFSRNRLVLVQAKSVHSDARRKSFVLEQKDLDGIRPEEPDTVGYLAVLDCAAPVTWLMVEYNRLRRFVAGPIHMVSIHAIANQTLSIECTGEFVRLVSCHLGELRNLDFHILCSRALRGESL